MATSGDTTFSVSRNDIIAEAMQICGVLGKGATPDSNALTDWGRSLNILVKSLNARPGMNLWAIERLVMFPVKNQIEYSFGASGDRMCKTSELIETELDGAHSSGATTLTVTGKDGTTGMANSDVIGVQTDSGGISWTTISGSPTSTTIPLASGISAAASSGNNVYTYTTVFAQNVLKVHDMWRRTDDGTDVPIELLSRQDYIYLSDKDSAGPVTSAYYDPQLGTGKLSVWQVPDDSYTSELLYLRASRRFEDFDSATDTPDFPQEWYLPLVFNLALNRASASGLTGGEFREVATLASQYLMEVLDFDVEPQSIYIVPDNEFNTYGL